MPFSPGDRLGAYEILSMLGAGGMGVVYRARDTRLGRDVAIKTLPDEVAADADRRSRFEREARALAALAHPNVASIFGFEQAGSAHLLVMELIEGETLAGWIARGPLPVERALPLFLQIAAGLEAAHAKGIIHRDLKPANVKIAASASSGSREIRPGAVKILDFGLAKALAPADGAVQSANASQSPTLALQATARGELFGTAAYMSPEQAQGEAADARADIWAFGVCLWETLTGRRAFRGANVSQVLASVLKDEPDFAALPASTPPEVRRLLRRCLTKDRDRRLHDIADARLELEEAMAAPEALREAPAVAAGGWSRLWVAIAAVAGIALGVAASLLVARWLRPVPPTITPARFVLSTPSDQPGLQELSSDLAITDDGGTVVYTSGTPPATTLHVRRLDQLEGEPLSGVLPGAHSPFLSPDGQWIGYFRSWQGQNTLLKVSIHGGTSVTLCTTDQPAGASWAADGTIVYGQLFGPLRRVAATGESPQDLTALETGEVAHRFPEFLPGGKTLVFTTFSGISRDTQEAAIDGLSLATGARKVLARGATSPRYASSGHLIYAVGPTLQAVAFDAGRLDLLGDPVPVLDGVARTYVGASKYAVSASGAVTYVEGATDTSLYELVWVDRNGREEAIGAPPRRYVYPRLSPDGTRIALDVRDAGEDIWTWDLERSTATRVTSSPLTDAGAVWSRDGRTIFYSSQQEGGGWDVFHRDADGRAEQVRLTHQDSFLLPATMTPDGTGLVAMRGARRAPPFELVLLDTAGKTEPKVLLDSSFNVTNPELSPDGQWLAYASAESGAQDVFVRPFPRLESGRWLVSANGGSRPLWSRNGKEIFYLDGNNLLTAVALATRGDAPVLGQPKVLIEKAYSTSHVGRTYDVSPDGQRFLMIRPEVQSEKASHRIVLVQNWFDELRRLALARRH